MTTFFNNYLEILKSAVLSNAGFKSIAPGDCRLISLKIFESTKQSISETTLKRVYGFAYSKFRPSLFTIDAMAKYCGYEGWDDFCQKQESLANSAAATNSSWEALKKNAAKITGFTLQALKNKSGIPYTQTIKRQFINQHLDAFLNGSYNATLLAAPAGCGKTLALCHWVDDVLNNSFRGASNDIILFFSSSALMNVFLSGRDLNDWLMGLLGYTTYNDVQSLFNDRGKNDGNFYLIIDGLDEHSYKSDQFQLLLNQVTDITALHQTTPWFKLILTVRSATWINYKHLLQNDNSRWYTNFMAGNANTGVNFPLFSLEEIKELCLKINPAIQNFLALNIAADFNHPLYFQFYYKEHKDNFSLNSINHICLYELISTFVLNKVYLGQHSAEKLLFLNGLVELMDLKNSIFDVNKLKVNPLIKQYGHAYHDLLSVGFLRELNTSTDLQYQIAVQFGSSNFLDYAIAKFLLQKNNNVFDTKLVNVINSNITDGQRRLCVLKWFVIYAAKTGQPNNFEMLAQAQLNPNQKADLLVFLGELLEKACSPLAKTDVIVQYFKKDCSDALFNYFFGIEFISTDYEHTLQVLLKFNLSNPKKILTYTALATIAALQLDVNKLGLYLSKLKTIPSEAYGSFAVNPLHCIDAIYQFFKQGIVKKSFFNDITRFYFNPPLQNSSPNEEKASDMVYLIAGYALAICDKPYKTLRYIRAIKRVSNTYSDPSPVNSFFMEIRRADSYFTLKQQCRFQQSYNSITAIYNQDETSFTPFMRSVFYNIKIKVALANGDYAAIPGYLNNLQEISRETGVVLASLFIIIQIINYPQMERLDVQLYKQVEQEYTQILRSKGLNPVIFNNPLVIA